MKKILCIVLAVACALSCVGCKKSGGADDPSASGGSDLLTSSAMQLSGPQPGDTVIVFNTSKGTIKAVLFADYAPQAVENFISLARDGYYNGLAFHRVIEDFLIQSGDPGTTGSGGVSSFGYGFGDEYSELLHNYCGALGMVHDPFGRNQSQFYIIAQDTVSDDMIAKMQAAGYSDEVIETYRTAGGAPHLDYNYTVFGQVYEGMDVVQKIAAVRTDAQNRPLSEVEIISISVETYSAGN